MSNLNKENVNQDRRFFSRKIFSMLSNSDYSINFFDEAGMFPASQGNIQKPNTISNGNFLLEGIGIGVFVNTTNNNTGHIKPTLTFQEITAYNCFIQNSIVRINESNKLIYEIHLVDILNPFVSTNVTTTNVTSQVESIPLNTLYNKLRINTPYLIRQEQTFSFAIVGRNLTNNTGEFIIYAEMLGRFSYRINYGAN